MPAPLLIADSGPLIALARLELLNLPARYFSDVLVTATVWDEVIRKPREDEGRQLHHAIEGGWLRLVANPAMDVDDPAEEIQTSGIDWGERSVLALAREMDAVVLIDDLRARRAAEKLALPVLGTIGLLSRARTSGAVGPLRPLFDTLSASGYFLPAELMRRVLAECDE